MATSFVTHSVRVLFFLVLCVAPAVSFAEELFGVTISFGARSYGTDLVSFDVDTGRASFVADLRPHWIVHEKAITRVGNNRVALLLKSSDPNADDVHLRIINTRTGLTEDQFQFPAPLAHQAKNSDEFYLGWNRMVPSVYMAFIDQVNTDAHIHLAAYHMPSSTFSYIDTVVTPNAGYQSLTFDKSRPGFYVVSRDSGGQLDKQIYFDFASRTLQPHLITPVPATARLLEQQVDPNTGTSLLLFQATQNLVEGLQFFATHWSPHTGGFIPTLPMPNEGGVFPRRGVLLRNYVHYTQFVATSGHDILLRTNLLRGTTDHVLLSGEYLELLAIF
ncbi:hypothetical protein MRY87_06400 [bacterium]|nr:hypothetical protein [bacterium]